MVRCSQDRISIAGAAGAVDFPRTPDSIVVAETGAQPLPPLLEETVPVPVSQRNSRIPRDCEEYGCLSTPTGSRTPVFELRTRRPGPLDDGGKALLNF